LHYLMAAFSLLAIVGFVTATWRMREEARDEVIGFAAIGGLFYLGVFALHTALGVGLRGLRPWARWVEGAVSGLVLALPSVTIVVSVFFGVVAVGVTYLVSALIVGYVLYLMLSAKGAVVFSPEYRDVIARTPHVKYRSSFLWILVAVGVVMLVLLA